MYGDDIILYMSFSYRDVDGAFSVLQEGLSLVERWMKANRLQLNARKTGVYVLRPPKMKIPICPPPTLNLQGEILQFSKEDLKWLGVDLNLKDTKIEKGRKRNQTNV